MLHFYRLLSYLISPLLPLWLRIRAMYGKEDKGRISERFGYSAYARPDGILLWIHAASVGEANSVLLLIKTLLEESPKLRILFTTGTVTSALLMKQKLPSGVIHQFLPIDTPDATERFIRHWQPDVAWFVESELWPNLIIAANRYSCFLSLINARISERSFSAWQKFPRFANDILGRFSCCFAQSDIDAERLRALGAKQVIVAGNIKYDATVLSCNENTLLAMKKSCEGRKIWLAASIHPGEEKIIASAHLMLTERYPNLLTIIVPRHPVRAKEIADNISEKGACILRSNQQQLSNNTAFYIADTIGELGLFYRLCEIAFIGGSMINHGGQNPLEAAKLSCSIISGSYTYNFADIYNDLQSAGALLRINSAMQLALNLELLFNNPQIRTEMQTAAKKILKQKAGASKLIVQSFLPLLSTTSKV